MLNSIIILLTFLLITIVPVAIIVMIIMAVVKKNKEDIKPLNFDKIIKSFYTYIVLIVFLFMLVGSIVYAFDSVANYLIPEKLTNEVYDLQTNNPQLQKMQEERYNQNQKNNSIIGITTSIAMIIVSAPIFVYHSRLAKEIKD